LCLPVEDSSVTFTPKKPSSSVPKGSGAVGMAKQSGNRKLYNKVVRAVRSVKRKRLYAEQFQRVIVSWVAVISMSMCALHGSRERRICVIGLRFKC
jgi:hypothetical protein